MHLVLHGLSHHTAPVELRERVDFSRGGVTRALEALASRTGVGEAVVLSTCNRVEVYATSADAAAARQVLPAFLADFHGVDAALLSGHTYTLLDADAARHLFRVAAGLDSLVVGEPQILGQVKDAYAAAAEQLTTDALLNRLFHAAFAVGKRVRSETGLSEGAVSVSYAAIGLARKIFGRLSERNVLVIGSGEMAKLTAVHLQAQKIRSLLVASRTAARAQALAAAVGGTALPWTRIPAALRDADIVVTATGAPEPVLLRTGIDEIVRARRERPLFIIDIAVPRDVEPSVGNIEEVFLYNIDDLQAIVQENLASRARELARAEAIVAEEVDRFSVWVRSRGAIPTVVALRQRFEAIRQAELKRLEGKMAPLGPDGRARVDEITRLIVEKLLSTPTEQLKAASDQATVAAYADALSRLFSLPAPEPEASERDEQPDSPVRS